MHQIFFVTYNVECRAIISGGGGTCHHDPPPLQTSEQGQGPILNWFSEDTRYLVSQSLVQSAVWVSRFEKIKEDKITVNSFLIFKIHLLFINFKFK